ncbi:MmcQ/YjbR family DNA-binding protein [Phytomonospora sp. NPDC050363]|uniref:MmcQ/YjbR family DNA-binding protein n=1 Tax=Phytomonospora sp. NPDC050363 TaxID=3155642 RepID=UPI0033C4FE5E
MIGLDDIRRFATALPEVEEGVHFRRPSFKVHGRPFVGPEQGETHAVVAVGREEAAIAVAEDPDVYEEVWRVEETDRVFVGLRVDLAKAPADRFAELVVHAWRNQAPKELMAGYDADDGGYA